MTFNMCSGNLPAELILDILVIVLADHPHPTNILCVNHLFHDIGTHILYSRLRFNTIRQLSLFAEGTEPLMCPPRTLTIRLSGGTADFDIFEHLSAVLRRCGAVLPEHSSSGQAGTVPLELLSLCLHSHSRNPKLRYIYEALSLANPKTFRWTGPDPEHHFSTAIVPTAAYHLFRAISTWTNIEHITITNLAFPSKDPGLPPEFITRKPLLPAIRSLRTLYLGQATMLQPAAIAAMVCLPGQDNLESVQLVDAYRESIWGPRIRRSDIEKAAESLSGDGRVEDRVKRIRRFVRCEARTERIMGGDRVEGLKTLD